MVEGVTLDCAKADVESSLTSFFEILGGIDMILVAYGQSGDQEFLEVDAPAAAELFATNFTSAAAWCLAAARIFERQSYGTLLVIGSVAGDRGRRSNYIYGASKAGLGVLVQGIAHRLSKCGGRAVLIKPGFVDTPITAGIVKKGPLWSKPDTLGRVIADAAVRGGPIVYAPSYWRLILLIIRAVPAAIFHRTRL